MTPDRLRSDTVGRVANKVRVFTPFNPHFCIPKYRSSDALPAPDIFLLERKKFTNFSYRFGKIRDARVRRN